MAAGKRQDSEHSGGGDRPKRGFVTDTDKSELHPVIQGTLAQFLEVVIVRLRRRPGSVFGQTPSNGPGVVSRNSRKSVFNT